MDYKLYISKKNIMKASDLRVGNLVFFGEKYLKCTVKGIKDFGIDVETDEEFFHCGYERIEPIPLTEEILLKCGFEKVNNDYPFKFIKNKGMSYEVEIENLNSTTCFTFSHGRKFSLVRIDYLHQLQNLYYSLCNQELEIKL